MRADLELLAALLVDMRRTVDGEALDMRRQRDRPAGLGTRALGRVDDLLRAVVEHPVIVGLEPDADILIVYGHRCPGPLQTAPAPLVAEERRCRLSPLGRDAGYDAGADRSASIAIGAISSTSIVTLSPGITISVPSGNCTTPVTSVVRK